MKELIELKQGIKYRGYGYLNEFGEFQFEPEQTGSRQGVVKQVTSGDGYVVSASKKYIFFHLKINRNQSPIERLNDMLKLFNPLIKILREYAF